MPWVLRDNALAPRESIKIDYTGENPFKIYPVLRRVFDVRLKIAGKDIFEDDFRWDITEDPRPYYVKIRLRRKFDMFSTGWVYIELRGSQPVDPTKIGKATLTLASELLTSYPINGWKRIFLPFIYIYHAAFYNAQRRKYLEVLRDFIRILEEEMRTTFKLK